MRTEVGLTFTIFVVFLQLSPMIMRNNHLRRVMQTPYGRHVRNPLGHVPQHTQLPIDAVLRTIHNLAIDLFAIVDPNETDRAALDA